MPNDLPIRSNPRTSFAVFRYTIRFLIPFFLFVAGIGFLVFILMPGSSKKWLFYTYNMVAWFGLAFVIASVTQLANWLYHWVNFVLQRFRSNV